MARDRTGGRVANPNGLHVVEDSPGPIVGSLRIAVVGPSANPLRQPFAGGMEALVSGLVVALRERGHDVTLFAGRGSDGADPDHAFTGGQWSPSLDALADRAMPSQAFMLDHHEHLSLVLHLARTGERFDIIHNHSLHHLPVAMAEAMPAPMVTTLHTPPTPWLESAADLGGGAVAAWTAVSRATARLWTRLPGPVEVIHNGVDLARWSPGPGGPDLVWSGRLVPEKAPHIAVEVARRLRLRLTIAGPVGDREYVERVIRPLLCDRVRYVGHLTQPALDRLVGHSAVALMTPEWEEPYGLVAAEAAACGTPVVAFARGGVPEIVVHGVTGFLVPGGDVTAMCGAVEAAVGLDRALIRSIAHRRLSTERMLDRYEALYRRVARPVPWSAAALTDELAAAVDA